MRCGLATTSLFCLLSAGLTVSIAAEKLDIRRYDRNHDGVLDKEETRIWLLHLSDPVLAKYDHNFNGVLDPNELAELMADMRKSLPQRSLQVADEVSFYAGRKVDDIEKAVAKKPPLAAEPPPELALPNCKDIQRVFLRRDRLDEFQFTDDSNTFITGVTPRSKAKGASISYLNDRIEQSRILSVNGRLSVIAAYQNPNDPCSYPNATDPYVQRPLIGYIFAPFVDAQGSLTSPRTKTEKSSLQTGIDAQVSLAAWGFIDYQVFVASPYGQTDFRGIARAEGVKAAWEPTISAVHLGGYVGESNPIVDWFWQTRAELDYKRVEKTGLTSLQVGSYAWVGATLRLNATFFPDLSDYAPFQQPLFAALTNRIYGSATLRFYHDLTPTSFRPFRNIAQYDAELGYHLTADGSTSISVEYTFGRDKDTLSKSNQYLAKLNYKY